jgi:D-glycerate 3-kinase
LSDQLLSRLIAEDAPGRSLLPELEADVLADPQDAQAFGIHTRNVQQQVQRRVDLLKTAQSDLNALCQRLGIPLPAVLDTLWHLWLPLALHLGQQRQALQRPFVQGILGGQGSGKTTLGAVLTLLLHHLGYRSLSLSLDDLYKPYADRLQLRQQDPRLIWRGPPGTHDVELGIQVLCHLKQKTSEAIAIPRFDKSLHNGAGDRIPGEIVSNIDIVLFEGWFVGVHPIPPTRFDTAPPPIVTQDDRAFARDINTRLHAYLPLWEQLDSLIVLYPVDYQFSKQWRRQAEQQMRSQGKPGMSDAEIDAFVDYFWKALHPQLFITPLVTTPGLADLVIEIDAQHRPGKVYRPKQEDRKESV